MFSIRNRDISFLILSKLDDKSLSNIRQVNKTLYLLLNNENFWINRLIEKYGANVCNLKNKDRTYRDFYLKIVYYYNKVLKVHIDHYNVLDEPMFYAARDGHKDLVEFFVYKGATFFALGLNNAAYGGHKELVDYFISKGTRNFGGGLNFARHGGHLELVKFFEEKMK